MRRGKENLAKLTIQAGSIGVLCAALVGCTSNPNRSSVEKNLLTERASSDHLRDVQNAYLVGCPDVLQIHIQGRDEQSGTFTVGPDGHIHLGGYGSVRVEGLTLPAIGQVVGDKMGVRSELVHVRIVEFASRHLILVGEVIGRHRSVTYQGNETVLDVLQRVGGITPGAEPTEIYVVRSHIGDLQRPEVFHVDLQAIVLNRNHQTNIRVQPYDQIFVGETRQARIEKCVPPWCRPVYQKFWDMLPNGKTPQEDQHSFTGWVRGLLTFGDSPAETKDSRPPAKD